MSHRAVNCTWSLLSFALQTGVVAVTIMESQQVNAEEQRARGPGVGPIPELAAISSGFLCLPFRVLSSGAKSLSQGWLGQPCLRSYCGEEEGEVRGQRVFSSMAPGPHSI